MRTAIYAITAYIVGAVAIAVLSHADEESLPGVLIAAAFLPLFVVFWRNRNNVQVEDEDSAGLDTWNDRRDRERRRELVAWNNMDPSRSESFGPGGINDPHRFD